MNKLKSRLNPLFASIFWSWNVCFIFIVYFGILPFVGIPLIMATIDGFVSYDFCITFFALVAVPTVSVIIGAKHLRSQPKNLIRWFYGVEAPLFVWCLVRLFVIRELNAASGLILVSLLICIAAYAVDILIGYQTDRKIYGLIQLAAHSLMLLMGIYLGLVLLFYAIPIAGWVSRGIVYFLIEFLSFGWVEPLFKELFRSGSWIVHSIWASFWVVVFLFFIGFSSTLFLGMPIAIPALYIKSGQQVLRAFAQQHNRLKATNLGVAVIGCWLVLLFVFNQQPQVKAFKLLEQKPQNQQELLASSKIIRKGLVNANLHPYRYLSTRQDSNNIRSMYRYLGLPRSAATFVQNQYNQLLSPFLYQGSSQDVDKSAQLYADFFDAPIQKKEKDSVRHALKSTSILDQAKAGVLNIDQKRVWLEKQEVQVDPHNDWADIEIHEVYTNTTTDVEEIFYYFSLPESAAITGVWLGETDKLSDRFKFQVSPRGAAQEVYNSQVQRRRPIDPALLEQVGPGQYRLRAFPVPPRLSSRDVKRGRAARKMHLWLNYKVMQQPEGWALPKLAEKRNIFWNKATARIRNGKRKWWFADVWLEDFAPVNSGSSTFNQSQDRQVELNNGYSVAIKSLNPANYSLPHQKNYALVVDTSYSMGEHRQELQSTLQQAQGNLQYSQVDFYLVDSQSDRADLVPDFKGLDVNNLTFFGSLQTQEILQKFVTASQNQKYDAVFIITDVGTYELAEDQAKVESFKTPLWMIHLGNELPRAYDDNTLELIQNSYGGVANDLATVVKRIATQEKNGAAIIDGFSWTVNQTSSESIPKATNVSFQANRQTSNEGIEPLAARQLVSYLSQQSKQKLSVSELDKIHQVAKDNAIVTPYSSMIVLVNDRQKELLKKAEARSDRFDREVETGVEQLNKPSNPLNVSGVPEPNLGILLGLLAIALGLIWQQQKTVKLSD